MSGEGQRDQDVAGSEGDGFDAAEVPFGGSRREFLRALGGAVGVAIAADAATISDLADAAPRRRSPLPSGYVWHRLIADDDAALAGVDKILPGVMLNDRSEVIFHAHMQDGGRAVYRMRIGRKRRPAAQPPQLIVRSGQTLPDGVVVERIGAGDTNRRGDYVTVIRGERFLDGVYIQRPGAQMERLIAPADRIPGPTGRYSGHFGDVDLDDSGAVLLVATYTLPGQAQQGLFALPGGRREGGRLLLRTGQGIPNSRAVITRLGLIERRGGHFIQQVFGRQRAHRARSDLKTEPSGFILGKVRRGRKGSRLLVGAKPLKVARSVVKGEAFVGPRVNEKGVAATVTHKKPGHLTLHRHKRRRAARIAHTGNRTRRGQRAQTISAPLFGPRGLLFYRAISSRGMELLAVAGNQRRMILETGDRIGGQRVQGFNTGWHTDQVDRRGRLAFQAEMTDGSTAIVIGTPV